MVMKGASSNALLALPCVVLVVIMMTRLSLSTAWTTTTTRFSYSRCINDEGQTRQLLHGHAPSTTNGVISESLSDDTAINRESSPAAMAKQKHTLHLLSLPSTDDAFTKPGEFLVRDCWKWKDSALGDGRDFFIPRPRALKAFQSLFVGMIIDVAVLDGIIDLTLTLPLPLTEGKQSDLRLRLPLENYSVGASMYDSMLQSSAQHSFSERFTIEECVVLSNCARLDVLLVLNNIQRPINLDSSANNITEITAIAARYAVAYNLNQQIHARRSKGTTLLERTGLSSWLDLPGVIDTSTATSSITQDQSTYVYQLGQRLISIEGPQAISTHLCLVACGLAPRTNRPDREVIFRPYSSRDAHIMLQLKRTVEVISVLSSDNPDGGGRGRIKAVIDGALSAGKAARNERVVPEIKKLKAYGSDGTPPSALAKEVANAAIEQAVKESVATCVSRLAGMDTNAVEHISYLRQRVTKVVASLGYCSDGNLQKMANKLLHTPTMQLREGVLTRDDIEDVVMTIEKELISQFNDIEHNGRHD